MAKNELNNNDIPIKWEWAELCAIVCVTVFCFTGKFSCDTNTNIPISLVVGRVVGSSLTNYDQSLNSQCTSHTLYYVCNVHMN